MEIIEYEKQKFNRSVLGYSLGLIGSGITFIIGIVCGIILFLFDGLVRTVLNTIVNELFLEIDFLNIFVTAEELYNYSFKFAILLLVIMFIGFVLSIYGTISYWKNPSISSCVLMIVGGVLSLIALIIPGIFIIIGGSINLFNLIKASN